MQEKWRKVKGFEGMYEVSNTGKVRTVPRTIFRKTKNGFHRPFEIKAKIKKPYQTKTGYVTMALVNKNKTFTTYLHRIIAEAWIKKKASDLTVVNHKNGIKSDNRIENLEWCTSGYNNKHAVKNKLRKPANAGLTEKQALQLHEMRKQGLTYQEISDITKIKKYTVGSFLSGKGYKWLNFQPT